MLLLVPSQKTSDGDGDQERDHPPHKQRSSTNKVLLILPPQTDLSSTVIVSDRAIKTTRNTTLLHSKDGGGTGMATSSWPKQGQEAKHEMHNMIHSGSCCSGKGNGRATQPSHPYASPCQQPQHALTPPLIQYRHPRKDSSKLWSQHLAFLEGFNSPAARSRSGAVSSETSCSSSRRHSQMDLFASNTTNAQYFKTRHVSLPPTTGQQDESRYRSQSHSRSGSLPRSRSPYPTDSSRILREAFKKAMTVQSPVLTSTSAGMVLDLSRGHDKEIHLKKSVTGDVDMDDGRQEVTAEVKRKSYENDANNNEIRDSSIGSLAIKPEKGEDAKDAALGMRSKLGSSRSPSLSSLSAPPSSQSRTFWDQSSPVMTAHDISLMTASLGALTPLEIQRRIYTSEQQSRLHLSTRRRGSRISSRKSVTTTAIAKGAAPTSGTTPLLQSNLQYQLHRFQNPNQGHYQNQGQNQGQGGRVSSIHPFDIPFQLHHQHHRLRLPPYKPSSSGLGLGSGVGDDVSRPIPSGYYYLPPSAFRTAADVAAEAREEAEGGRYQEKERKDIDEIGPEDEFLVFSE
ncbi:hypothetical protein EDD21DRAFT_427262 [Dissophora ornata]|nr:hypothetical protein EDD21DRAFT_427262 [Dissophora ornata]